MKLNNSRGLLVLLPSLRISGGVQETLRLAVALVERGVSVQILVLWKHAHESPTLDLPVEYLSDFVPNKSRALLEFPLLLFRYLQWMSVFLRRPGWSRPSILLTHFSTFPFAWLSPRLPRFCFNQDVEWMFVPAGPLRVAVRWLILFTSRRSRVITTNEYISGKYLECGVKAFAQASLWASSFWLTKGTQQERPIDVVMLLRHGAVKRPELYLKLIKRLREITSLRCAVITPESELYAQISGLVDDSRLRPSNEEIRDLYGMCKVFVLLSDTEGFGLPPLEAMGSGCVPLCRDSGGVRCYLQGKLAANLVPADESIEDIVKRLRILLVNEKGLAAISEVARQTFSEGLLEARIEREKSFDMIADTLKV